MGMVVLAAFLVSTTYASQDEAQRAAIQKLEQASTSAVQIVFDSVTGVPRFITLRVPTYAALTAEKASYRFLEDYKALFKMAQPSQELSVKAVQRDRLGMTHVRMFQSLGNVPVFGHELVVHIDREGSIYAVNGKFVPQVEVQTLTPALSAQRAIEIALSDVGPTLYRWDTQLEQMLPPGKTWRPTADLVIYEHNAQFRLAYRTMIAVEEPEPANWVYFIDAMTGEVLYRYNDLKHASEPERTVPEPPKQDAVGKGYSLYRGPLSINTNSKWQFFEMVDNIRGLTTYNARNKLRLPGLLFRDLDNTWGDGTKSHPQSAAVDAHAGAADTADYYLNTHGRDSYDDAGAQIISTVHYRRNYVNAFWNGEQMVYGDGDGVTSDPLVALDVISHELTHAVTEYTANLIYQDQSGALNESISDVFAMMVDRDDFMIGEDCWTPGVPGDALRYMDDPPKGGQPNHMEDYVVTPEDNGGVHTNSGITNFAAYLATAGGTGKLGDVVTGIGHDKVEQIWYRALSVYMTSSTDFADARLTTIQAATDIYGAASSEVQTIKDAWTAVGVGTSLQSSTVVTFDEPASIGN